VQTACEKRHWANIIPTQSEQTTLLAAAGLSAPEREVMRAGFTILKAQRPAV